MKILFIAPYRDGTGWSEAAKRVILAIDKAGGDIVIRPIRYNNNKEKIHSRLLELESKSSVGCDIVIQNCLPHNFEHSSNFKKNIGFWWTETETFKVSHWPERINLLDHGFVTNRQAGWAAANSGVTIPLTTVDIPFLEKTVYEKEYPKLDIPELTKKYVFYWIGEFNRRKNPAALLTAFHTAFDPHENVELVIKTSIPGLTPEQTKDEVIQFCRGVKTALKMYPNHKYYKEEIIITQRMTDEQLYGLHQSCNCLVVPSSGEGLCLPISDAWVFQKEIIRSEGDYHFVGNTAPVIEEPCTGMNESWQELYSSHDTWWKVDVIQLGKIMRKTYEETSLSKRSHNDYWEKIMTPEKVGNRWLEAINDA